MTDRQNNNKRIVKNTLLLYIRMIISMIVSLFTARIVLKLLGVSDYGISNVVSSIVGFSAIITAAMVQATQRFLSYDLGKNDINQYQKTYSMLVNIYILICVIAVVLFEAIGPFVISNYLVIPKDRLYAAQWVFQLSVINFVIDTMNIPQTSSIVSYEKMGVYAYFTILDVVFKLLVVLALYVTPGDRLITNALLGTLWCFVRNIIVLHYCRKHLLGCKYRKYWEKSYFKKIAGYLGWSLLGSTNQAMMTQGQSIILNLFFGPIVNAAKAIADRVHSVIYSFVSNFYMALTPQIVKTYAAGERDYTTSLVLRSSKYAFLFLACLSFPLISNMDDVLYIWLGREQVSLTMIHFCQSILVFGLISSLETPITKVVQATGNVKQYEIYVGIITLSFIPLCYLIFKLGADAYLSMVLLCVVYFVAQLYRVYYLRSVLQIHFSTYFKRVFTPIIIVSLLYFFVIAILNHFLFEQIQTHFFIRIILCLIVIVLLILTCGLKKEEVKYGITIIKKRILNKFK